MSRRIYKILLGLFMATASLPAVTADAAPPPPTRPADIELGAELTALRDVELRDARLSKGARVRVVKITAKDGRPTALSLELEDGHVLRDVSIRKVQANFKRSS